MINYPRYVNVLPPANNTNRILLTVTHNLEPRTFLFFQTLEDHKSCLRISAPWGSRMASVLVGSSAEKGTLQNLFPCLDIRTRDYQSSSEAYTAFIVRRTQKPLHIVFPTQVYNQGALDAPTMLNSFSSSLKAVPVPTPELESELQVYRYIIIASVGVRIFFCGYFSRLTI